MSSAPVSRRRFLAVAAAATGGVVRLEGGVTPVPAVVAPTNVMLVVLDTVRYDRFTALARAGDLPNMSSLAERGVRYENAWAPTSWSLPSHATLLTGRLPLEHHADWPSLRLDPATPTLAGWFATQGYAAGAFSGNSNWVTSEYLGRGFLRFRAYNLEAHLRRTTLGRPLGRALQPFGGHFAGRGRKAPELNREVLRFVDRYAAERPFFAYLTYMDTNQALYHEKLDRPFWWPAARADQVVAAYDQGLRILDRQFGELLAALAARGLDARTVIAVVSDHGESFGRVHREEGHGSSLYPEQTRVPMFVVAPGAPFAGSVVRDLVGIARLPATLARLAGRPDAPFPGPPLPLSPPAEAPREAPDVLMTLRYAGRGLEGIVGGELLLLRASRHRDEVELYDLAADPEARYPLAATDPRRAAMIVRLDRQLRDHGAIV